MSLALFTGRGSPNFPAPGGDYIENPKIEAAAVRVGEAARLLGMSEPAVRQMIYRRLLPTTRIGTRVFVRMDEVNRILSAK